MQEAGRERLVLVLALGVPDRRQGAQSVAVVSPVARDELVPSRLAVLVVVLARYLEGGIVRLGAGVGVEDRVLVFEPLVELLPQLYGGCVALEQRVEGQGLHLLVGGPGQLLSSVAHVHGPQPAHAVKVPVTARVRDPGPLRLGDHHRGGVGVVTGHRVPDVAAVSVEPSLGFLHYASPPFGVRRARPGSYSESTRAFPFDVGPGRSPLAEIGQGPPLPQNWFRSVSLLRRPWPAPSPSSCGRSRHTSRGNVPAASKHPV